MGDRTFSADDVIRIYQDFLTAPEQETVDFFFFIEPEPEEPSDIIDRLREVISLLGLLRTTLPGFIGAIITFAPGLLGILSLLTVAVANASNILNTLIEEETSA